MDQKVVPDPFNKDYQKAFKKLASYFPPNPVIFNREIMKNKRGPELVTSYSLVYKASPKNILF